MVAERGATGRLAHAFQALVPEHDRQRQLLALAEKEVAAVGARTGSVVHRAVENVEGMLTSYTDEAYVSSEYGRELSSARTRAVDVERISDDPPERMAGMARNGQRRRRCAISTISCSSICSSIEEDPPRWRDVAQTVVSHADDLVRVGHFDQAWLLAEAVAERAADRARIVSRTPGQRSNSSASGSMLKHAAAQLRGTSDEGYERFKRICHTAGTAIVAPLAEALSSEQDARARRRLRDILIGFGAQGRESVQKLMSAPNWEVRRTAAFLLREFGGTEGLKELIPLLTDTEPLVQREAVQGVMHERQRRSLGNSASRAHDGNRPNARNAGQRAAGHERRARGAALLLSREAHETERVPENLFGGGRSAGRLRRRRRRSRR